MEYRFLLTRGQLVGSILVLLLTAILLYVSGLLTGLWVERRAVAAAAEEAVEEGTELAAEEDPAEAPAATESGEPDELSLPPERIYELQMNAYLTREAALPDVERLAAAGYQAYVVESLDSQDRSLFTVRVGPWGSMEEAAKASRSFIEHSGIDDMQPVIRHRPRPAGNGPVGNGPASDGPAAEGPVASADPEAG